MPNLGTSILALLAGGATGVAQGRERRREEDRTDFQRSQDAREREDVRLQAQKDREEERRIRDQQIGIESTRATAEAQRQTRQDKAAADERTYQHGRDTVEDTFKEIQAQTNKRFLDQEFNIKSLDLQNQGLQQLITVLRATRDGADPNANTTNAQKFVAQGLVEALKDLSDTPPDKQSEYLKGLTDFLHKRAYELYGTAGSEQLDALIRESAAGDTAGALPSFMHPGASFAPQYGAFAYPGATSGGAPVDVTQILDPRLRAIAAGARAETNQIRTEK